MTASTHARALSQLDADDFVAQGTTLRGLQAYYMPSDMMAEALAPPPAKIPVGTLTLTTQPGWISAEYESAKQDYSAHNPKHGGR